jgi:hypothetical protein
MNVVSYRTASSIGSLLKFRQWLHPHLSGAAVLPGGIVEGTDDGGGVMEVLPTI